MTVRVRTTSQPANRAFNLQGRLEQLDIAGISWRAFLWAFAFLAILNSVVSPRFYGDDLSTSPAALVQADTAMAGQIVILSTLAVLGTGSVIIMLSLRNVRFDAGGVWLWLSLLAFGATLLPSVFLGIDGGGFAGLLVLPVAATALFMTLPYRLDSFLRHARWILLTYAYGSLAAIALLPGIALERDYQQGMIDRFDIRLHGIATHANELAPLLLMFLVLEWCRDESSRTCLRWIHIPVVFFAIILTQSKTMWAALPLLGLIYLVFGTGARRFVVAYLVALPVSLLLLVISLVQPQFFSATWDRFSESEQVDTFTGRDSVWQYTLDVWSLNPWFGYGPRLWGTEMAIAVAAEVGWVAQHAHNQAIHTLGQAGIVGLIGLIAFAIALLVYGVRSARMTYGASLGLIAILGIRATMEVPLHVSITAGFLFVAIMFGFLVVAARRQRQVEDSGHQEFADSFNYSGLKRNQRI